MEIKTSLLRKKTFEDENFLKNLYISLLFLFIFIILEKFVLTPNKFNIFFPIKKSISIFLTYVLYREIDPDSSYKSSFAVIFSGIILIFFDTTGIIPIIFIILSTRFFTRSVGIEPNIIDYIILLFFSILGFVFYNYLFTFYLGVIFLLDYFFKKSNILSFIFSVPLIILSIMTFFKIYNFSKVDFEILELALASIAVLLFTIRLSFMKMVLSEKDNKNEFISPKRLKMIDFITGLFTIFFVITTGSVKSISGLISVMILSSIPFINDLLLQNKTN